MEPQFVRNELGISKVQALLLQMLLFPDVSLTKWFRWFGTNRRSKENYFEKFIDGETVDVSLLINGSCTATHIDNLKTIAENRKDCVVFNSTERSDVVAVNDSNTQTTNVINFYNDIGSSSYVVFDSGYKYLMRQIPFDVYRYILKRRC